MVGDGGSVRRRLSLAHLSCLSVPPAELVRLAAAAGFDQVGAVRLTPTRDGFVHPMLGPAALRRPTWDALRDTGLTVLDVEVVRLRPDTDVRDAEPLLEAGADLGAAHVLTTVEDEDRARRAETFAALCRLARLYGLRVMVEPMVFSAVRTPAVAVGLLRDAGNDGAVDTGAGILVDCLHLARAGGTPDDLDGLDPALLPYVQLCDAAWSGPAASPHEASLEAVSERLPPGQGVLPLRELVRRLPPASVLSLEVPNPRAAADPGGWFRELAQATRALLAAEDLVAAGEAAHRTQQGHDGDRDPPGAAVPSS